MWDIRLNRGSVKEKWQIRGRRGRGIGNQSWALSHDVCTIDSDCRACVAALRGLRRDHQLRFVFMLWML